MSPVVWLQESTLNYWEDSTVQFKRGEETFLKELDLHRNGIGFLKKRVLNPQKYSSRGWVNSVKDKESPYWAKDPLLGHSFGTGVQFCFFEWKIFSSWKAKSALKIFEPQATIMPSPLYPSFLLRAFVSLEEWFLGDQRHRSIFSDGCLLPLGQNDVLMGSLGLCRKMWTPGLPCPQQQGGDGDGTRRWPTYWWK